MSSRFSSERISVKTSTVLFARISAEEDRRCGRHVRLLQLSYPY